MQIYLFSGSLSLRPLCVSHAVVVIKDQFNTPPGKSICEICREVANASPFVGLIAHRISLKEDGGFQVRL
jgi:hypothetical protein